MKLWQDDEHWMGEWQAMGEGDQWQVRKAFQIKDPFKFQAQEEDGMSDEGLFGWGGWTDTNERQTKSTIGVEKDAFGIRKVRTRSYRILPEF